MKLSDAKLLKLRTQNYLRIVIFFRNLILIIKRRHEE